MLACRHTSAAVLYSTGGLDAPKYSNAAEHESEGSLYYYRFLLSGGAQNMITHQWALSAIPFELPTASSVCSMAAPNFIYGCSSKDSIFTAAPGRPMRIDCRATINVKTFIQLGIQNEPKAGIGCVDERAVQEICASDDPEDPIKIFQPPEGWYAQELQFLPRTSRKSEDDGYLLTLMFDESQ